MIWLANHIMVQVVAVINHPMVGLIGHVTVGAMDHDMVGDQARLTARQIASARQIEGDHVLGR